jgi:hypothetical protein
MENATTLKDQKFGVFEAVNPKISEDAYKDQTLKGKRGEADNVYDPVSLAHMRLNRKEVHSDYNPSYPDAINHKNAHRVQVKQTHTLYAVWQVLLIWA